MKASITFLQGIIIAIVIPIVLLIIFVIFSSQNTFRLVERDYYQKELNHQSQIDRKTRTNRLSQKVNIYNDDKGLVLQFPSKFIFGDINGKIIFFRPSDPNLDFSLQIVLNQDGLQSINNTELKRGAWIVKVFWNNQKDKYYSEKRIYVNH